MHAVRVQTLDTYFAHVLFPLFTMVDHDKGENKLLSH